MPLLQPTENIERLEIPAGIAPGVAEGEWIEIDKTYPAARRRRLQLKAAESDDAGDVRIELNDFKQALLEEIIKAWSDVDDEGKSIPVTAEAVGQLHPFIQDWIYATWLGWNRQRTADEKKESAPPSSQTSNTAAPSRKNSRTSSRSAGSKNTA